MQALIAAGNYVSNIAGGATKTVTTAGTRVQLSTTKFLCEGVCIQALETNTGYVAVGGPDVVATASSARVCFVTLAPGASAIIPIIDLKQVYIDATTNSNIVTYGPLR